MGDSAVSASRTTVSVGARLKALVPILTWGRSYDRSNLRPDLIAGVTVAAVAIPENMAYATMAGLPPQVGHYASLVSMLVYFLLGTSSKLAYGPTSALSIMVAGTLGSMAFVDADEYAKAASFVAVSAGVIALLAWFLRLGIVANFVSETVLVGFSAGAALFIGSSQISKLFGIHGAEGNFFQRIWNVISNFGDTNWWAFAIGFTCLVALILLDRFFPKLPAPLLVVIAAIVLMWLTDLEDRGVEVAGSITQGLPTPMIPTVPSSDIVQLIGLAFGVFLLSYVEGVGAAKTLAGRTDKIRPDQELLANGMTNIATGFFRGYAVGGSMSRSAVTATSGGKTPLVGAVVAVVLAIVLLFLTKPFSFLPEATLAAIVLMAVRHLFKYKDLSRIWNADRREAMAAFAALAGVLIFGMLEGIIVGVLVTFVLLLAKMAKPEVSVLGRLSGTSEFVDVSRNPDAETRSDVFVFRANSGWFYANAPTIVEQVKSEVDRLEQTPAVVIIDMAPAAIIDLGAVNALDELNDELNAGGIDLELANVYAKVAEMLSDNAPGLAGVQANESIDSILAKRDRLQESSNVQEQ